MSLRHFLLNFLQDRKTRVSVFMKKQLQNECGSFRIDLQKPLDAGVVLPQLRSPGGHIPYEFRFKDNKDVITLGSNVFNDTAISERTGPRAALPLLGLLMRRNRQAEPVPALPLQCETLQLCLTRTQPLKVDVLQVQVQDEDQGENLLHLFDQAVTLA